jgi:hypothetical protein
LDGDQEYIAAPVANRFTLLPEHTVVSEGVTAITGRLFTLTITVVVELQPDEVPVTV